MKSLLATLTSLGSALNAAAGFRTYAMVVAAVLFYAGGLVDVLPDSASQKLAGTCVGLAIAFDRAAQKDHAASLQSTLQSVITILSGKPDPTPPTASEYQQLVNDVLTRVSTNLGIPVSLVEQEPPPLQVFQPDSHKAA